MKWRRILVVVVALVVSPIARAEAQSSSTNYQVQESSFSSGSGLGSSASYSAQGSAGDVAVGSAYSTNYGAYAGPINPSEEYLEFVVNSASIDLNTVSGDPGILSATEVATGSATFYVRAYLNATYVVRSYGSTLTSENNSTIDAITSAGTSSPGNEQFGINLVDNASPDIGANPSFDPSNSFADGEAATGYSTADNFQFNDGDIIAQHGTNPTNPAWGQTNYTISYIANISTITDAGSYTMTHTLVATPTF
ncbi:MAG TPA: hypothetical protein PKD15_06050 [Candidatus Saccharibacteria bacterium]|jgi:hypothetical protein|nr:hypothetical protein [Candidatus Saccharibacteria bacterium]